MLEGYICIDTGNSATKIVYYLPGMSKVEYFLMSSALDEVSPRRLQNHLKRINCIGIPKPEQQAWLRWDERVVAVGALAEEFSPPDRRAEPKYENALYKVLAAIGVIIETYALSARKTLKVHLGLLLPWNEYKDRDRLLNQLKLLSQDYEFRGRKLRLKLERCVCYPEGGGLAMMRMRLKGKDWFQKQRMGVFMLGDRNWTGLCFESGQIVKGASPLSGFSFMLDRIIEDAPCLLERERLSRAIFAEVYRVQKQQGDFEHPVWQESEAIETLATARAASLRASEVKDISRAIESVVMEWEEKLTSFLEQVFPKPLSELNVCGGPLPFFAPVIGKHFNCIPQQSEADAHPLDFGKPFTPVLVGAGAVEQVEAVLQFEEPAALESALSFRFVDAFSLFDYLTAGVKDNG